MSNTKRVSSWRASSKKIETVLRTETASQKFFADRLELAAHESWCGLKFDSAAVNLILTQMAAWETRTFLVQKSRDSKHCFAVEPSRLPVLRDRENPKNMLATLVAWARKPVLEDRWGHWPSSASGTLVSRRFQTSSQPRSMAAEGPPVLRSL